MHTHNITRTLLGMTLDLLSPDMGEMLWNFLISLAINMGEKKKIAQNQNSSPEYLTTNHFGLFIDTIKECNQVLS
jgi:hypothetical protein